MKSGGDVGRRDGGEGSERLASAALLSPQQSSDRPEPEPSEILHSLRRLVQKRRIFYGQAGRKGGGVSHIGPDRKQKGNF